LALVRSAGKTPRRSWMVAISCCYFYRKPRHWFYTGSNKHNMIKKNLELRPFKYCFNVLTIINFLSYFLLKGHWRFPRDKEMQGYAYTLTHPGTPSVFFDHIFSHYKKEIAALLSIRKRNGISCRSKVSIRIFYYIPLFFFDNSIIYDLGPVCNSLFLSLYKTTYANI
jgi:hypothetical protein